MKQYLLVRVVVLWGGSLAHTGCPLLDIPVSMDAGELAQRMVRFVCSDLNSKSLCLWSVLVSWIR